MAGKRRHRGQSPRRRGGSAAGGLPGGGPGRPADRKTLQLCGQIRKTLEYLLSGETGDDTLRQLYVQSVDPAPDASRLLVTVSPIDRTAPPDPIKVLEKLGFANGFLRAGVARAINRKKVPDLSFTVSGFDAARPNTPDEIEVGDPEPPRPKRGPTLDPADLLAAAARERANEEPP